jgi:hypothetical protein
MLTQVQRCIIEDCKECQILRNEGATAKPFELTSLRAELDRLSPTPLLLPPRSSRRPSTRCDSCQCQSSLIRIHLHFFIGCSPASEFAMRRIASPNRIPSLSTRPHARSAAESQSPAHLPARTHPERLSSPGTPSRRAISAPVEDVSSDDEEDEEEQEEPEEEENGVSALRAASTPPYRVEAGGKAAGQVESRYPRIIEILLDPSFVDMRTSLVFKPMGASCRHSLQMRLLNAYLPMKIALPKSRNQKKRKRLFMKIVLPAWRSAIWALVTGGNRLSSGHPLAGLMYEILQTIFCAKVKSA